MYRLSRLLANYMACQYDRRKDEGEGEGGITYAKIKLTSPNPKLAIKAFFSLAPACLKIVDE